MPPSEIPAAFDQIKPLLPSNVIEVVQYFEDYYVHGRVQQELRNGSLVHSPPLFPPTLWSVHELVEHGHPRTQNTVEAWHHWWNTLIGRAHVGIYTIIEEMRKEQQQTNIQIENIICGEPRLSQLMMAPKLLLLIAETEMPKLVFHSCRN